MSSLQVDQWQTLATTRMQSYWRIKCREQQQQHHHHSDNNNNKICWFLYERTCLYSLTAVSCFFDSVGLIFTTITVSGWAAFELIEGIFGVIITTSKQFLDFIPIHLLFSRNFYAEIRICDVLSRVFMF